MKLKEPRLYIELHTICIFVTADFYPKLDASIRIKRLDWKGWRIMFWWFDMWKHR